jgi:pSer/pThr/pTyr-binding forkhead associated (FHA) protein
LKPYDVDYSNSGSSKNEDNNVKDGKKQAMLQLIERTELSKRKFILNPYSVIRIGSDIEGNDITVHAAGVSPHQCEIFAVDNKIYIRNLGSPNRTILKRKKESAIVDDKGVRLLSKDKIVVGTVIYDVSVINK